MDTDDEGDSSVLGRHDHWEEVYARELINLRQHGDRGEVWYLASTVLTLHLILENSVLACPAPALCRLITILFCCTFLGLLGQQFLNRLASSQKRLRS